MAIKITVMKLSKLFLFFFFTISIIGQNAPVLKVGDSMSIDLNHLSVKTEIIGNIAVTTYQMKFYNKAQRILEGELIFPLSQGQTVSNFAMDVNGRMRNAVIVEKELGRVAYENTVRQVIDPGLLELTKGNNYKARVYPIPSMGYKTIEITFEEELKVSKGKYIYYLPFSFQKPLEFNFDISIYNSDVRPNIIKGNKYGIGFKTSDYKTSSSIMKKSILADEDFLMEIPLVKSQVTSTYTDYFNVYKAFTPKTKIKSKPKTITVFWDASLSMKYRDIKEEFSLLNYYFEYLQDVDVDLIVFSNAIKFEKNYKIISGNWQNLKKDLSTIQYDGGTSYLQLPKSEADEILFFTDGMFNLGELIKTNESNIYSVNALNSANHEFLNRLAQQNNGKYINLKRISVDQGLSELKTESYKFLGVKDNSKIFEVYPKKGTIVDHGFSVSGRFKENTEVELLFGYGNKVEEYVTVELNSSNFNSLPKKLWAKKKLQYLNFYKEHNKDKIVSLAKKYHLISDYTSLIVLDRLEDYLRYKIEPPKELKAEYKELISSVELEDKRRQDEIKERREELIEDYEELKKWYHTKYPITKRIKKVNTPQTIQNTNQQVAIRQSSTPSSNTTENTNINNNINSQRTELDQNKNIVTGIITADSDGLPLPGVNVIVKGTTRGTTTDFDGKYALNAEPNETLVISYIGFVSRELSLNSSLNNIDVVLSEDSSNLDEVVVVAYSASTQKRTVSASVQIVKSESVTESLNTLKGQVAGVSISKTNRNSGSDSSIIVRGQSSSVVGQSPLYIIDGKIVDEVESYKVETDSIHSMTVLKDANAQAIYGSRGVNGVIVITTKKGLEENSEEIKALDEKIYNDIQFKPWNPDSDYIKILSAEKDVNSAYSKYLDLQIKYRNTPSFFIDVADFFDSKNNKALAIRVLSNLAEIDLDNHEILRALAYKLDYFKQYKLALSVYKEILKLRPEEPQSTRDLALAYENVGEYQKAFDMLYSIVDGKLLEKDENERFYGIEHIALVEAGHLLKKYKNKISLTQKQRELVFPIDIDLRIVADWNHNDTDLDLWVDNPKDQKISYKNKSTDYGDRLSEDMTDGYGPEEYLIKKGLKGSYEIELDYYADNVQKISGPTVLKITIFKNYGKANEIKEVRVLRLTGDGKDDTIEVGSINF